MSAPQRFAVRSSRREAGLVALIAGLSLLLRGAEIERHLLAVDRHWLLVAGDAFHILLFVGALATALVFLLRRPSIVEVGPEGIMARIHSPVMIPWLAIEYAWPAHDDILCLRLRDPGRYPAQGWLRWFRGWLMPPDAHVAIPMVHARGQIYPLMEAIDAYRPGLLRNL